MCDLLQELIGKIKRKGLVLGLCAAGTIFGGGGSVHGGVIAAVVTFR